MNKNPGANGFQIGNKPRGGAVKGSKHNSPTVWMLEALAKRGYNFEQELVDALRAMKSDDQKTSQRALEQLDRLIKIAPHIANRPKETVGMEGIENLVIKEFVEDAPATNGAT